MRKNKSDYLSSLVFGAYLLQVNPDKKTKEFVKGLGRKKFIETGQEFVDIGGLSKKLYPFSFKFTPTFQRIPYSYDMAYGLIGEGMRALQKPQSPRTREQLAYIIKSLDMSALKQGKKTAWYTYYQKKLRKGKPVFAPYIVLGMPRGIFGAIAFLSICYTLKINSKTCKRLIRGTFEYMLHIEKLCKGPNGFPYFWGRRRARSRRKNCWAAGDVVAGLVLALAGTRCKESKWIEHGRRIFYRGVRKSPRDAQVIGAPFFYNGCGGIAHLALRFYHLTGEQEAMMQSRRWFNLAARYYKEGLTPDDRIRNKIGTLHTSSQGMCLVDWTRKGLIDSKWDAVYGISNPVTGELV